MNGFPLLSVALAALLGQAAPAFLDDPESAQRWQVLEGEERSLRLWAYGWSAFLGAVVVGQTVIAATTDDRGARTSALANIAFTGAGLVSVLLTLPPAGWGLEAIRAMPEVTAAQRDAKARALRALFHRAAQEEAFYRSAFNHVVGLAVNAGLAAILWFGYRLGARALLTLAAGSLIWEAQIFTHRHDAATLAEFPSPGLQLQRRAHAVGPATDFQRSDAKQIGRLPTGGNLFGALGSTSTLSTRRAWPPRSWCSGAPARRPPSSRPTPGARSPCGWCAHTPSRPPCSGPSSPSRSWCSCTALRPRDRTATSRCRCRAWCPGPWTGRRSAGAQRS